MQIDIVPNSLAWEGMDSIKQAALLMVVRLPDDCTAEDIQYHLSVLGKVRNHLERAALCGVVDEDEAESRLACWIKEEPRATASPSGPLTDDDVFGMVS